MFTTIFFGVGMFTAVVVALVMVILAARSKLVASGNINIEINGEDDSSTCKCCCKRWRMPIFSPAPVRWRHCAQCGCCRRGRRFVASTEATHFTRREANDGWRLSCQTPVKQDMKIEIPEESLGYGSAPLNQTIMLQPSSRNSY